MRFQGNYHTHSTLCDGKSTLRENVEEALRVIEECREAFWAANAREKEEKE